MLGAWAPSLEELYAADNNASDVAEVAAASSADGNKKVDGFRRLKSLDLSETELSSWQQVWACVVCSVGFVARSFRAVRACRCRRCWCCCDLGWSWLEAVALHPGCRGCRELVGWTLLCMRRDGPVIGRTPDSQGASLCGC